LNKFKNEAKKDYEKEFNRNFDEDLKILSEKLGNYNDIFNEFK
jgi:hypothetical protein